MSDLSRSEREELERYKAKAKKLSNYRNKFIKENYKRLVCLYPIEEASVVEELLKKENMSISSYIQNLIKKDLQDRGLI